MVKIPSGRQQPDILRTPDRKPNDFRATSQQQGNAGAYDDRGGGRLKKVSWIVIGVVAVAIVVATVIDAVAGRKLI